jgi:hypothetical protein
MDVLRYTIVGGVPAKRIGTRDLTVMDELLGVTGLVR